MSQPRTFLRPHERSAAIAAAATLGLVLAAHALLETARDALFLRSLPPEELPWVYLLVALVAFALARVERALAKDARSTERLAVFLLGAGLVTACAWALADFVSVASIWVLYVWTGVFGTLATIHAWLAVSGAFTLRQAKRVFGVVGAGALVGALAGSTLARALVAIAPTRDLVLVASAFMLAAALAARLLLGPALHRVRAKRAPRRPRERRAHGAR